jgi:hypothetical protein
MICAAALAVATPSLGASGSPLLLAQTTPPVEPLPQTPPDLTDEKDLPPEPAPINPPAEIQPGTPSTNQPASPPAEQPATPPAAGEDEPPASQAPDDTGAAVPDTLKGHAQQPGQSEEALEPQFDLSKLPFPARRMRELLLEAAQSGDIEKLRPYIGESDDATLLSFGGVDGDPIEFLKGLSGDGEGYEILAILEDVLQAGFVHFDPGTENELYIWPYFYGVPLDKLSPPQRVELYRLVTHGDYEDMKSFGAYNFYRIGITPQGRWRFFVAGD